MAEARFAVRSCAFVNGIQKLLYLVFGLDASFDLAARETELIPPIRHACFHHGFKRRVSLGRSPVGRADAEDVRDEFGVPECGPVGDGSSLFFPLTVNPKAPSSPERRGGQPTHPIMSSQDDRRTAQLPR